MGEGSGEHARCVCARARGCMRVGERGEGGEKKERARTRAKGGIDSERNESRNSEREMEREAGREREVGRGRDGEREGRREGKGEEDGGREGERQTAYARGACGVGGFMHMRERRERREREVLGRDFWMVYWIY